MNDDVDALVQYITKYPEITKPVATYIGDIFYMATARGGVDVLRALMQHYVSNASTMQPPNERGFLFLNVACQYCRVDTLRLLLEDYPEYTDIHARAKMDQSAILAAANWSGFNIDNEASRRDEIMHMLLDKGASAEDFSQWPHFPTELTIELDQPLENVLTLAVPWASPGLIKRLIDKGADPDEKTYTYSTGDRVVTKRRVITSGVTALFVARIYWNVEVIEVLLRYHKGSDDAAELVSRCDSYGRLPIHWAAGGNKEGFHPSLIDNPDFSKRAVNTLKLLVESNPRTVNAQDSREKLHSEFDRMMKTLLEAGGDKVMNGRNTAGMTAKDIFEEILIRRSNITMPERENLHFRVFPMGRGTGKNSIHPVGMSLGRRR